MKILVIGDVVGRCGRNILFEKLPELIRENNIDFTVVNGENATTGNGINEKYASMIFEAGADAVTLGNHSFDKKDLFHMLETDRRIIRPLNLSPDLPGDGVAVSDKGVAVINILGRTYMKEEVTNPFSLLEKAVENIKRKYDIKTILVDFHAEATSEKQALGFFMDGKITALYGTHTHVQTNDIKILKNGTAYVTDIGMTGSEDSVIGLEKEIAVNRFAFNSKDKFKWGELSPMINGAIFETDDMTGKAVGASLIYNRY